MELLIENWGIPNGYDKPILESYEVSDNETLPPGLYIEGIFLQSNVINGNKRLYPKVVLEKAVDKYIKEQINSKQSLGEMNHPDRAYADPMSSAIILEKLWWDNDNVLGRARVVEGDHAQGDKLAALIRAGWIPGVSSRGLGSVKDTGKGYKIVQEGFKLTVGVDVVWSPSAPDAYVKSKLVKESNINSDVVDNKLNLDQLINNLNKRI